MATGQHTRPEKTVDKNGKVTTVHKGRKPTSTAAHDRSSVVGAPSSPVQSYKGVTVGQTFSSPYSDSEIDYTVKRFNGDIVFAEAGENQWGISESPFGIEEVRRSIAWREKFENSQQSTDSFWNDVEVGKIVHYSNGWQKFVRGEVVQDSDGSKKMKPIALIGDWDKYELPMRNPNGEIKNGYHVQSIIDGKLFAPNPSSIWEAMTSEQRSVKAYEDANAAGGPSKMPAVDITIPEMNPEESRLARIESLLEKIPEAATKWDTSPEERIESVRALLAQIEQES